jgi:hypothetical protein
MKLKLRRVYRGPTYTIGHLYINDKYFCDTLEDTCRIVSGDCSQKIYARTAIPEGLYKVEILWWDKHQDYYPHIINVPCFEGILIHGGIDENDTEGCVLLGENKTKGHLTNCLTYVRQLVILLKGQQATIEIL